MNCNRPKRNDAKKIDTFFNGFVNFFNHFSSFNDCFSFFLSLPALSQVIAFICGNIVVILLIMALTSTDWLLSSGWRQGLFTHCIEDLTQPIPFNYEAKEEGCYPSRDVCKLNTAPKLFGTMSIVHTEKFYYTHNDTNGQWNWKCSAEECSYSILLRFNCNWNQLNIWSSTGSQLRLSMAF